MQGEQTKETIHPLNSCTCLCQLGSYNWFFVNVKVLYNLYPLSSTKGFSLLLILLDCTQNKCSIGGKVAFSVNDGFGVDSPSVLIDAKHLPRTRDDLILNVIVDFPVSIHCFDLEDLNVSLLYFDNYVVLCYHKYYCQTSILQTF